MIGKVFDERFCHAIFLATKCTIFAELESNASSYGYSNQQITQIPAMNLWIEHETLSSSWWAFRKTFFAFIVRWEIEHGQKLQWKHFIRSDLAAHEKNWLVSLFLSLFCQSKYRIQSDSSCRNFFALIMNDSSDFCLLLRLFVGCFANLVGLSIFLLSDTELFHFQLFCSHTDMANLMMGCYFYRISMSVSRFYLWNVLKDLINLFFCNIFTGFSWHLRETRNNFENLINNISVNWDIKCMSILRSLNFLCFAMQSFIWDRLWELFRKSGDSASFLKIHNIFELCTSPNWINGQFRIWNLNFFSLSDFFVKTKCECFKRSIFRYSSNFWWLSGLPRHIWSEPNCRFDLYHL